MRTDWAFLCVWWYRLVAFLSHHGATHMHWHRWEAVCLENDPIEVDPHLHVGTRCVPGRQGVQLVPLGLIPSGMSTMRGRKPIRGR